MSFDKLLRKVEQAEDALEARERQVSADMRQFKRSWRLTWTPGRIVIAGLVSGFAFGRAEPLRTVAKSGNAMQIVSMLSTLFAGTSAKAASEEAENAADVASDKAVASTADPAAPVVAEVPGTPQPVPQPVIEPSDP